MSHDAPTSVVWHRNCMAGHEAVPDADWTHTTERLARRAWPATPIRRQIEVSFEYFPPTTPAATRSLFECAEQLDAFAPTFSSVTYGAGGSSRERTHQTIADLQARTAAPIAGHLTAVGATRRAVDKEIDRYARAGVRHIVALRGDASDEHRPDPDGYETAADLVVGIRALVEHDVEISVAAYPEVHPKASSPDDDVDNLKAKLDAGADRAITQFFFDTDVFLRFRDRARTAGITAPIVPGIMPVWNFANIVRFSARCGTEIPDWMPELFGSLDDTPEIRQMVAATVAAEQCRRLAEHGVDRFHFYTMNRPSLVAATCHMLGLKPVVNDPSVHDSSTQVAS